MTFICLPKNFWTDPKSFFHLIAVTETAGCALGAGCFFCSLLEIFDHDEWLKRVRSTVGMGERGSCEMGVSSSTACSTQESTSALGKVHLHRDDCRIILR